MFKQSILLLISLGTLYGCKAEQLGTDQLGMYTTVRNIQENQILQNLILAQNNRHFIQINYSDFVGKVAQSASMNMTGSHSAARASQFVADIFNPTFNGSNNSDLSITGRTITDKVEVYQAYFAYLTEHELKTGYPATEEVHLDKWFEGKYYYVPKSQAPDFQKLATVTTNSPGSVYKPIPKNDSYGEAVRVDAVNGTSGNLDYIVTLKDTAPFPVNALELVIGENVERFEVQPFDMNSKGMKLDLNKPSDIIVVKDNAKEVLKNIHGDELTKTFVDHRPLHLFKVPVVAEATVVRVDRISSPMAPVRLLLTLADIPPFVVNEIELAIGESGPGHGPVKFKAYSAGVTSEGKKVAADEPTDLIYVEDDSNNTLKNLSEKALMDNFLEHRSIQLHTKRDANGRPMLVDPAKLQRPLKLNKYPDLAPPTQGRQDTQDVGRILDRIRLQSDLRSFDELRSQ